MLQPDLIHHVPHHTGKQLLPDGEKSSSSLCQSFFVFFGGLVFIDLSEMTYSKNGSPLREYLRATSSFRVTPRPGPSGSRIEPFCMIGFGIPSTRSFQNGTTEA